MSNSGPSNPSNAGVHPNSTVGGGSAAANATFITRLGSSSGSICVYTPVAVALRLLVFISGILLVYYLGWQTRNVRKAFNESGLAMALVAFIALILFIEATVLFYGKNRTWYWALTTQMLHLILVVVIFWSIMFKPLIGCVRYRDDHLRTFVNNLQLDPSVTSKLDWDSPEKGARVDRRSMVHMTQQDPQLIGAFPVPEILNESESELSVPGNWLRRGSMI